MRCSSVRKQIQSLVTGELDKATAARILEHMESCAECANEKATYERLIADLSTPRPMAALPASLDTLRIVDEQLRRTPALKLVIASFGTVAAVIVMLFISIHRQPVQPHAIPPIKQQVAQVKTQAEVPTAVLKPAPAPAPMQQVRHRIIIAPKRVVHPRVVIRRYTAPHPYLQQQPKPIQQVKPTAPTVNQSKLNVDIVAQAPQLPPSIDVEITDDAIGRVDIEHHIGNGPVCSLSIE